MKAFLDKRFKALLTIQIALVLAVLGTFVWGLIKNRNANINANDIILSMLFISVIATYFGNLLYNLKLLRVYHFAAYQLPFSKVFSTFLLCIFTICNFILLWLLADILIDILWSDNIDGMPFNYKLYSWFLAAFLFTLSFTGIWTIILQIKLLRLLKGRQHTKADELLAQLGTESENPR